MRNGAAARPDGFVRLRLNPARSDYLCHIQNASRPLILVFHFRAFRAFRGSDFTKRTQMIDPRYAWNTGPEVGRDRRARRVVVSTGSSARHVLRGSALAYDGSIFYETNPNEKH